jgi:hypothetical protein
LNTKWLVLVGILVAVLGIAAVACDDDESEADLTARLCSDLVNLQAADAAFDTLDETSTVEDLESLNSAYASALDDVVDSANAVGDIRVDGIEDAYNDLDQAIDDVPSDATISDGLASIQPAVDAVGEAYVAAFSSVGC